MTLGEWLSARTPRPPATLALRIHEILGESLERDSAEGADIMLHASENIIAALLASDATTRDSALDLLAADSLVTYAFEAASDDAAGIGPRATLAMQRISMMARAEL